MPEANRLANPYDWINPVPNSAIFAGRTEETSEIMEELTKLKDEAHSNPTVALIGERRIGKTSILLRVKELCQQESLPCVIITIDDRMAGDAWEFWKEVYYALFSLAHAIGIKLVSNESRPMGFIIPEKDPSASSNSLILDNLKFLSVYLVHMSAPESITLSYQIVKSDLDVFNEQFRSKGCDGVVLMFDEAHNLVAARELKQHLRTIVQQTSGWGIIFSGETALSRMFTDTAEPFFGQAKIIRVDNFAKLDDVSECALLPLQEKDLKLISPMTINYLAKLSLGKPNQIRLICSSIYKRFMRGLQADLNITIDVLDDILDDLAGAYRDSELRQLVSAIQKLNSSDLEVLHNMTRYPDWSLDDIIDLDESFRGESKSTLAIERRKTFLEAKKKEFVAVGLMKKQDNVYQLSGSEFLSLYLRFYYETQKYGSLSRRLILGGGPPTVFGETTEKLVRSLAFHFGQDLEIQRLIFHQYHRDFGSIIETVERRFAALEELKVGKKQFNEISKELLSEVFSVCELIGREGEYYLLCLSVRSRDNPREVIQAELYFDVRDRSAVDLGSLFNLLNKQAEEARVLIEGYRGVWVDLPELGGLLKTTSVTLEQLIKRLPLVGKWWLSSVDHAVHSRKTNESGGKSDEDEEDDSDRRKYEWLELYADGKASEAEKVLVREISKTPARCEQARLYNDLGYIRSGNNETLQAAYKDLETGLDLHSSYLQLTLLNLSFLDIKNEDYRKAIERIEAALFLSLSPREIGAFYLRLCLPEYKLGFKNYWEQHPANVIEAAYVNLGYALLKDGKLDQAKSALTEGLELMPSSVYLTNALARFYLYKKEARPAYSLYEKLSKSRLLLNETMKREVDYFVKVSGRTKGNRKKNKRR